MLSVSGLGGSDKGKSHRLNVAIDLFFRCFVQTFFVYLSTFSNPTTLLPFLLQIAGYSKLRIRQPQLVGTCGDGDPGTRIYPFKGRYIPGDMGK